MEPIWSAISESISAASGAQFKACSQRRLSGGCINQAYVIEGGGQKYFAKLNDASGLPMFEAEAAGLIELGSAHAVRVPHPTCSGVAGQTSFIVMEYLALGGRGSMADFGRQLAMLHRTRARRFGWHIDNTLGSAPQINTPSSDWCEFWRTRRLGYQLEVAARNGHRGALLEKGNRLMACCDRLFAEHHPQPALLHGDLWSGNYAIEVGGGAVIFDPAVYYGDREADLAMTELFGGFGDEFYSAYREAYPLHVGYSLRKVFYNLYHVLNHLNLFGGTYARQAEQMMDIVLGELRS
jgi:fructosamine-3-kinase